LGSKGKAGRLAADASRRLVQKAGRRQTETQVEELAGRLSRKVDRRRKSRVKWTAELDG